MTIKDLTANTTITTERYESLVEGNRRYLALRERVEAIEAWANDQLKMENRPKRENCSEYMLGALDEEERLVKELRALLDAPTEERSEASPQD
jgi:hypothetical protein